MADDVMAPILFTCTVIVFVCVWILNPLTIAAILRSHTIRTTYSNIFILNLAVADLLLITMALALTGQQLRGHDELSPVLCTLRLIAFGTLVMGSILSSFAIAVDRFLYIAKPVRYPAIVTHTVVLVSVVVIWLLSLANTFLPFYNQTGFHGTGCNDPTESDRLLSISMAIMGTIFVGLHIISTSMYIKMFLIIQKHHKLVESLSKARSVSLGNDSKSLKSANRHRTSSSKSCTDNHHGSSPPDMGLEFSTTSCTSQYDFNIEMKANNRSISNVIRNDEPEMQEADFTSDVQTSLDDREINVVLENNDDLQNHCHSGTDSGFAVFRNENENGGSPEPERKVKAVYHVPFSIRGKKFVFPSSQSGSSREEGQSASCISGKRKFRISKFRYSFRDFRTIKTLMIMGNLYFLCWSPLITMKTLQRCFSIEIDANLVHAASILGIANSILNFIVYPLRKAELRNTFKRMLLPVKRRFLSLCQS